MSEDARTKDPLKEGWITPGARLENIEHILESMAEREKTTNILLSVIEEKTRFLFRSFVVMFVWNVIITYRLVVGAWISPF